MQDTQEYVLFVDGDEMKLCKCDDSYDPQNTQSMDIDRLENWFKKIGFTREYVGYSIVNFLESPVHLNLTEEQVKDFYNKKGYTYAFYFDCIRRYMNRTDSNELGTEIDKMCFEMKSLEIVAEA